FGGPPALWSREIDDGGDENPVPGERAEGAALKEPKEAGHREPGRREGDEKADGEEGDVAGAEQAPRLIEVVDRGGGEGRHGSEEGIFGGGLTIDPREHSPQDRGGGAGDPRPERQALEQSDLERLSPADPIEIGG